MNAASKVQLQVVRRLLPLYVGMFLQGFVLWYAVEKLFMRHIGFDNAGIGIMVAAYSAVMLLVETPSGILADRWSRKGVLVIASILLAASSYVGGISHDIPMYLACAGLWGMFFALYSGTWDSILYDTLLEMHGHADDYERYYGRLKVVDSAALVLGSLAGGWLASRFGLPSPYFWTIIPALAAIGALFFFREPTLHKAHAQTNIAQHVGQTFRAVLQKGWVLYILAVLVILSALSYGLFEFSQLWWIALAIPVAGFGLANGLLLSTIGMGGLVASRLRLHRLGAIRITLSSMLVSAFGLVFWHNRVGIVACQVVASTGIVALIVVFNKFLHDALPSQVRAGASSAVSSLTRVVLIPFSLLFGFVSRQMSVFAAGWMLVVLVLTAGVVTTKMFAIEQDRSPAETVAKPKNSKNNRTV